MSDWKLSSDEEHLIHVFNQMDDDARVALVNVMSRMARDPAMVETMTEDEFMQMATAERLEVIRRRLGGTVGQVLQFKKDV